MLASNRPVPHLSALAWLLPALGLGLGGAWLAVQVLHFRLTFTHWPQALWVLAGAPLIEEWLFRATLQPLVQSRIAVAAPQWPVAASHALAIAAVSLLFALCHWPLLAAQSLWLVLPSLLLGYCWALTRRLWPCVLLHAALNGGLALFTALFTA